MSTSVVPEPTTTTSTTAKYQPVTTLATELKLLDMGTVYFIAASIILVPVIVVVICLLRGLARYRSETKITDNQDLELHEHAVEDTSSKVDDDDDTFQHPAPAAPRTNTFKGLDIAGPFGRPVSRIEDPRGQRSDVVSPSFINTSVVEDSGFPGRTRYTYIP